MQNPGIKNLGDAALSAINAATGGAIITSASDRQGVSQSYLDRLEGMNSATVAVNFNWGSGGTSLDVYVETTLDQGTTWVQVAHAHFTTASAQKLFNLSAETDQVDAFTPAALANDKGQWGIFGDRWRARIITVGTYGGNTSLSVRMSAR